MSKSKGNTIDFSSLDEETDTDGRGDSDYVGHNVDLDILQPHLPPPPSTAARRNVHQRGVVVFDSDSQDNALPCPSADDTIEHANADFVDVDQQSFDHNSNHVANHQHNQTDNVQNSSIPTAVATESNAPNGEARSDSNPVQICYSKNTGNISVQEVQVSTREDGSHYIATQQIPAQWEENERRPLRKKRIRWIKIFSIVACILFFPTGIPAAYFAFRIEKEFEQGILRGNIDRAQKFATRSERLIILSSVLCIIVALLIVTLIERPNFRNKHYHHGTITG